MEEKDNEATEKEKEMHQLLAKNTALEQEMEEIKKVNNLKKLQEKFVSIVKLNDNT